MHIPEHLPQKGGPQKPWPPGLHWPPYWVLVLGWAAVIWVFSTYLFSSLATERCILPILQALFPHASPRALLWLHAGIRKAAHLLEYFVFSLLLFRAIRADRPGWKLSWALAAVVLAACYAVSDEVHQAFVPTRGASARDVLLDSAGAAAAQLLTWWRGRFSQSVSS